MTHLHVVVIRRGCDFERSSTVTEEELEGRKIRARGDITGALRLLDQQSYPLV